MLKKLLIGLLLAVLLVVLGLPTFAQTYAATKIPGQPLATIAAEQIIANSGLPTEKLPNGTTSPVTRGRDAVNAYRYAHTMLYKNGWYRGISEDHTPLLKAMVGVLEGEGYTSSKPTWEQRKTQILHNFWYDSDTQNAKELGYSSLEGMYTALEALSRSGKAGDKARVAEIQTAFEGKWK